MLNRLTISLLFWAAGACSAWADYTFKDGVLAIAGETDLAGKSLMFQGVTAMTGTGSFTDTVGGGVLTIDVPEGAAITNGANSCMVRFSGGLRLVKKGAGVFSIANSASGGIATHDFTGGIQVLAGTLKTDKYGHIDDRLVTKDKPTPFGFEPVVTVESGATLDLYGCYGLATMTVRLKGGTVTSSRTDNNKDHRLLSRVELEADSTFHVLNDSKAYNFCGELRLNGHTLTLDVNSVFYWNPTGTEGDAGLIVTTRRPYQVSGVLTVMDDTDLHQYDLEAGIRMNLTANLSVRNYTPNSATNDVDSAGGLKVYGRMTPPQKKKFFYPATLQGGAVLDLSQRRDVWLMTNAKGEGLSFASDGEAIVIDVGTRDFAGGTRVVSWPAEMADRARGVKFVVNQEAFAKGYRVLCEEQGLTIRRRSFLFEVR